MGKTKLEKQVEAARLMAVIGLALVGLLSLTMLGQQLKGRAVKAAPVEEPDVALATLNEYSGVEAERISKLAAVLMGMGGKYTATCSASYNMTADVAAREYSITWRRETPGAEGEEATVVTETWSGATWAECVQRMLAWKEGGA